MAEEQSFQRLKYLISAALGLFSLYVIIVEKTTVSFRIRGNLLIILSFCIAYLLTPAMCAIAERFGIVDTPSKRKMHQKDTPLLGGAAIFLAFSIGAVSMLWYSYELKGVVYAATLIFILGLLDDIVKLSSIFRLVVQLLAVFILFYHGLEIDFAPDFTSFRILDKILTVLWILGITNAVNFLDGMDGLCGGFGAIAAFFFGLLAFMTEQPFLMFLAFSLSGSCLGFLPWNFRLRKSARIFMGDAGSLFIGFTLASFALMGDWAENRTVALASAGSYSVHADIRYFDDIVSQGQGGSGHNSAGMARLCWERPLSSSYLFDGNKKKRLGDYSICGQYIARFFSGYRKNRRAA